MSAKQTPPTTLMIPPFPLLTWNGHAWTGYAVLKSWEGLQSRLGPYGSRSSDRPSDGTVRLSVDPSLPPSTRCSLKQMPSRAQVGASGYLMDHEHAIRDRVLRAILEFYNAVAHLYIEAGVEDLPSTLSSSDQLRELIGHSTIYVLAEAKDGVPYLGFEFGCEWDAEHGLGVMTHQGDVVAIGEADTAFCPPR